MTAPIINSLFELLSSYEPTIKALTTVYSIVDNYQRDKKLEFFDKEIVYIKEHLGLSSYELNDNELKIMDIFLSESEQKNKTLIVITSTFNELIEKTNFNEQILRDVLLNLKSENFIEENRGINNNIEYKLNYFVFEKSNLVEKISSNATNYYSILNFTVDKLLEMDSNGAYIDVDVNRFMNEHSLNHFFINPIMIHLESKDIIEYYGSQPSSILINDQFYVKDKSKLLKYRKQLSLNPND